MNIGDHVLHKGRKAEIVGEKYGLICIRYFDDLTKNWVNSDSLSKI